MSVLTTAIFSTSEKLFPQNELRLLAMKQLVSQDNIQGENSKLDRQSSNKKPALYLRSNISRQYRKIQ
jgi:hypothetical protein